MTQTVTISSFEIQNSATPFDVLEGGPTAHMVVTGKVDAVDRLLRITVTAASVEDGMTWLHLRTPGPALVAAQAEHKRRAAALAKAQVWTLDEYTDGGFEPPISRWMLVLDESDMSDADQEMVGVLASIGWKTGIHFLVGAREPAHLNRQLRNNAGHVAI